MARDALGWANGCRRRCIGLGVPDETIVRWGLAELRGDTEDSGYLVSMNCDVYHRSSVSVYSAMLGIER